DGGCSIPAPEPGETQSDEHGRTVQYTGRSARDGRLRLRRAEAPDEGGERLPPSPLLLALGQVAEHRSAQLGVGKAFHQGVELDGRLANRLAAEKPGVVEALHPRPEPRPRALPGRGQLRSRREVLDRA